MNALSGASAHGCRLVGKDRNGVLFFPCLPVRDELHGIGVYTRLSDVFRMLRDILTMYNRFLSFFPYVVEKGRNPLLLSSALTLLLPLLTFLVVYSMFEDSLYTAEKQSCYRIAEYFKTLVDLDDPSRSAPLPEGEGVRQFRAFAKSFDLYKIKIFSGKGTIIFSTDPSELGVVNEKPYFHSVVAKGEVFQKRVAKDSFSAQGIKVTRDVVETYVPIMGGDGFHGAVEIYTDITDSMMSMRRILYSATAASALLGLSLLSVVVFVDRKAIRAENALLIESLNSERLGAVADLNKSERRLKAVFEQSTAGIAQVSMDGVLMKSNARCGELFRRSAKDMSGLSLGDLVHPGDLETILRHLGRAAGSGEEMTEYEVRPNLPDATSVWVRLAFSVIRRETGEADSLLMVCEDVTERVLAERVHAFLARSGSRADEDFFRSSAKYLSETLGMDFVCFDQLIDDGESARTLAVFHNGGFRENMTYSLKDTPCENVGKRTQCNYQRGVREAFPNSVLLRELQAESYAGAPLRNARGEAIGLIALVGRRPLSDQAAVDSALRLFSLRASGELERRLAREAGAREALLNASMSKLACGFLESRSLSGMASLTLDEALRLTGGQSGYVGCLDQETGEFIFPAATDDLGGGGSVPGEAGVFGRIHDCCAGMITGGMPHLGGSASVAAGREEAGRYVCAQAMRGEKLVGQIALAGASRDFDQADATAAQRLASVFALGARRYFAEKELEAAKAAADAANLAKSEFLAVMSHEIRTPLNGALGMLQLLERTNLDAAQKEKLSTALRSTRRLTRLLSDILDLSRVESNKLTLNMAEFAAEDLRESVCDVFSPEAEGKGVHFSFHLDGGIPPRLIGDETRVRQLLFNLVGNAVKFTGKGSVMVTAERVSLPDEPRLRVLFTVSDTGPGIAGERLGDVFEPFIQGDGIPFRGQGAGLGLTITRRLAALMEGSVCLESEEGVGTKAYVMIPFLEGSAANVCASAREASELRPPSRSLRTLLAEDEEVSRVVLASMLEFLGHVAATAQDGREALALLSEGEFDLMIVDIQMPVMDGLELTRAVRNKERQAAGAGMPILAITAHDMRGDREMFFGSGIDGFLAKPVELGALEREIHEIMDRKSREAPTRQDAPDASPVG